MRRYALLIGISLLLTISSVSLADEVIISLPALTGDYETGWVPPMTAPVARQTTFSIPPDVLSIDEVRLVLSGTWVEGLIICDYGTGDPDSSAFTPGLSLWLDAEPIPDLDFIHATIAPPHGTFDEWSAVFESCCPPGSVDLNLLLGTEIEAELFCDLILILPCWVEIDSYGTLTDVSIEITGAVPTKSHTWGQVKALYR
jgi:hypothetical protein